MTTLYLCEKPSQARDIANVLGVTKKTKDAIETRQGIVTWALGHLLEQAPPEEYSTDWKKWSFDVLPMVPEQWKHLPRKKVSRQLNAVGRLLKRTNTVIIATDADREGEAIGRELLDYFSFQGSIKRLWLSALDPKSIQKALSTAQTRIRDRTPLSCRHGTPTCGLVAWNEPHPCRQPGVR